MTRPTPEAPPHLDFLRESGAAGLDHTGGTPLLAHLVGVRSLLLAWGARNALVDAGLFHSVYGTEFFAPATVAPSLRDRVRARIGVEAEEIAWLWCTIRRGTLGENIPRDADFSVVGRHRDEPIALGAQRLGDLVTLWAADTLEQLPRLEPEGTRFQATLYGLRGRALPAARRALEEAFGDRDFAYAP